MNTLSSVLLFSVLATLGQVFAGSTIIPASYREKSFLRNATMALVTLETFSQGYKSGSPDLDLFPNFWDQLKSITPFVLEDNYDKRILPLYRVRCIFALGRMRPDLLVAKAQPDFKTLLSDYNKQRKTYINPIDLNSKMIQGTATGHLVNAILCPAEPKDLKISDRLISDALEEISKVFHYPIKTFSDAEEVAIFLGNYPVATLMHLAEIDTLPQGERPKHLEVAEVLNLKSKFTASGFHC